MTSEPMNIRMVDTVGQYRGIQAEIDEAVRQVIQSGMYIGGPTVKRFSENLSAYLEGAHVIPCANGTDALQIAMMALDLKPGDEIIVPSFTFIATVEVLALLGLKPVFIDVEESTFNLDVSQLSRLLTPKTRAIVPVHLFGQSVDMTPVMEFARANNLYVIEDAAQAIGGKYHFSDGTSRKVGTIGDIGCTSFYPSKNLGAYGDGGAIFTRNPELAKRIQTICNHGSQERYHHHMIGVNSRLDAIQAAILDVKLRKLDEYHAARVAAASHYTAQLSDVEGVITPITAAYTDHVFHQYTLRITGGRAVRDAVKETLQQEGIPAMIYYPIPCHLQEAYLDYGGQVGSLPISEKLAGEVLSLPMHTELTDLQLTHITSQLKKALYLHYSLSKPN